MCDPVVAPLAVSAGLSLGSTLMNQRAQNKVDRERASALDAERMRQNRFQEEQEALALRSQQDFTEAPKQLVETQTSLEDVLAPTTDFARSDILAPVTSTNTIRVEQDLLSDEAAASQDRTRDLAQLRSLGDLLGGAAINQGRAAGELASINSFRNASNAILPLELDAANNAGRQYNLFGDLLSAGSTVAGGLSRLPAGAPAPAPTSAPLPVPRPRR